MKKHLILTFLLCATTSFAQDATANFSVDKQVIDGFGAADRNVGQLTDAQADLFFSTTAGIGLSILRSGIEPDGTNSSFYSNATKAAARGAIIWAAPWTAPAIQKDNNSLTNGGHLLAGSYNTWATTLAGVQASYQSNAGVNLYAISVQNEPDFSASYESMLYTAAEMTAFIKVLGPKLAALTPVPKLILPELANWSNTWGYTSNALGDGTAAPYVGIVGAHQYSGVSAPSGIGSLHVWQTEMSYFNNYDTSITSAITTAQDIHSALITGNVNAYLYWELNGAGTDNEGLIGQNSDFTITKRYYAFGNYSKFVRPSWYRVDVSGGPSGVTVDAFRSSTGNQIAVVAINTSGSAVSLGVNCNGINVISVIPYVTSSTQNLEAQTAVNLSAGKFTSTIANNTITTFYGSQPLSYSRFRIP